MVVYHHRKTELNDFNKRTDNIFPGIYFSLKPFTWFGNYQIAAFLNIKNPANISSEITTDMDIDTEKYYQKEGYDGAIGIFTDLDETEKHLEGKIAEIVVFKPNQIKSATSNTGTFSTTNDDIRYSSITEQPIKVPSVTSFAERLQGQQQPKFAYLVARGEISTSCR